VIARRDLHGATHTVAHILDEQIAGNPVALSDAMRKDQLCISVDAANAKARAESQRGKLRTP
jgi:hypothetical protein